MTNQFSQQEVQKVEALAEEKGWNEVELQHALENLENDYGDECVIKLKNGREVRTPAYPDECSYVRITQEGYELAYWVSDEWADDPENVMGAIMGCAHGG